MRISALSLAIFIGACSGSTGHAEHVEKGNAYGPRAAVSRVGDVLFRVQNYSEGNCTLVHLASSTHREPLVDSCHGWRMSSCGGTILVVSADPRLDTGSLVRSGPANPESGQVDVLDLNARLGAALNRVGKPRRELLGLSFADPRCGADGMLIPFEGSYTNESGDDGRGHAISGEISVRGDRVGVEFRRQ